MWALYLLLGIITGGAITYLIFMFLIKKQKDKAIAEESIKETEEINTPLETEIKEEPSLEETRLSEEVVDFSSEDTIMEDSTEEDTDDVTEKDEVTGKLIITRYNKSFTAKLIQATEEVKERYNIIKNYLLSHKGINSRISWNAETFKQGHNQLVKLGIRGKTLVMFIALEPNRFKDTRFKGTDVGETRKYTKVPFMYRLNGPLKIKYAIELIDMLSLEKGIEQNTNYIQEYPYDTLENLIKRNLVKLIANDEAIISSEAITNKGISVAKAEEIMSDTEAANIIINKVTKIDMSHKAIVNIDILSKSFNDNDVVTLEKMKELKLVSKKTTYVKVLANGTLNKKLKVEANDYSLAAVKMIKLTNGEAIKLSE